MGQDESIIIRALHCALIESQSKACYQGSILAATAKIIDDGF